MMIFSAVCKARLLTAVMRGNKMKRLGLQKRGEALISVIIAVAVVVILGLAAMFVARNNFNMKILDRESSKNFYTAESVINDVAAGLQTVMSDVYTASYTDIMEKYRQFEDVEQMKKDFEAAYVIALIARIRDNEAISTAYGTYRYNVDTLKRYVNASKYADCVWTLTADDGKANEEVIDENAIEAGLIDSDDNILETQSDGIVLKNIHVTFKNSKGYYNEITTDIRLKVPDLSFSLISAMPNIGEYSIVAEGGLDIKETRALGIEGNFYAGHGYSSSRDSIMLGSASYLDLSKSTLAIANGTIVLNGGTLLTGGTLSGITNSRNTSLWAENITVNAHGNNGDGNDLLLYGRTYVKDDLSVEGANSHLRLWGKYYGFSDSPLSASGSSSLVINAKGASIDMSHLDTLLLAGTGFVGTSAATATGHSNQEDILTGDSVAIKTNQLIYLVPTECSGIVCNPMSYEQFALLYPDTGNRTADREAWENAKRTALDTVIASIHSSISAYGQVDIVPIYSQHDGGTVYLYLKFKVVDEASHYFRDMIASGSALGNKIGDYTRKYLSALTLHPDCQIITEGNYIVPGEYDAETNQWSGETDPTYVGSREDPTSVSSFISSTASSYRALCKKLVMTESSLTGDELSDENTVFTNLIDTEAISNLFDCEISNGAEKDGNVITFRNDSGIVGIIANNKNGNAYTINNDGRGILIATGNVILKANWHGIIICDGVLSVEDGAVSAQKIAYNNAANVGLAFRMMCEATETDGSSRKVSFMEVMKGAKGYSLPGTDGSDSVDRADVRNCLAFENWRIG